MTNSLTATAPKNTRFCSAYMAGIGVAKLGAVLMLGLAVFYFFAGGRMPAISQTAEYGCTFLGLGVSLFALAVAIAIFQKQAADSTTKHQQLLDSSKDIATTQTQFAAAQEELRDEVHRLNLVASVPETETEKAAASDENAPVALDLDMKGGQRVQIGDKTGLYFGRDEVPLSVIADLVWGWRMEGIGRDRTWTISHLVGAFRATGPGNFPWLLHFQRPDGTEQIWRMYRGGNSKKGPTVRNLADSQEALDLGGVAVD